MFFSLINSLGIKSLPFFKLLNAVIASSLVLLKGITLLGANLPDNLLFIIEEFPQ